MLLEIILGLFRIYQGEDISSRISRRVLVLHLQWRVHFGSDGNWAEYDKQTPSSGQHIGIAPLASGSVGLDPSCS